MLRVSTWSLPSSSARMVAGMRPRTPPPSTLRMVMRLPTWPLACCPMNPIGMATLLRTRLQLEHQGSNYNNRRSGVVDTEEHCLVREPVFVGDRRGWGAGGRAGAGWLLLCFSSTFYPPSSIPCLSSWGYTVHVSKRPLRFALR